MPNVEFDGIKGYTQPFLASCNNCVCSHEVKSFSSICFQSFCRQNPFQSSYYCVFFLFFFSLFKITRKMLLLASINVPQYSTCTYGSNFLCVTENMWFDLTRYIAIRLFPLSRRSDSELLKLGLEISSLIRRSVTFKFKFLNRVQSQVTLLFF